MQKGFFMVILISLQYPADEEARLLCCDVCIGINYDVGSPTSKSRMRTLKIDGVSMYIAELINLVYFYMQCSMISVTMLIRKYLKMSSDDVSRQYKKPMILKFKKSMYTMKFISVELCYSYPTRYIL